METSNYFIVVELNIFLLCYINFLRVRVKNMAKKKGAQSVETVPGRRIVVSSAVGNTNVDEIKWLTNIVLASASQWKNTGWAYVADCSKMDPVSPAEGGELVAMTKKFVEAGCKAFGFAEGTSIIMITPTIFIKRTLL